MKIEKKFLTRLDLCYAPAFTLVDGELRILFATEGHGPCYQFRGEQMEQSTVWSGPGGTMTMVAVPGRKGDFLAVQNFFPTFQAEGSTVVWSTPKPDGSWQIRNVLDLSFLHRFDVLPVNGVNYFLAATLCTSKKDKDDWSAPGKIYVGVLPDEPGPIAVRPIKQGLVRNHGYSRVLWKGKTSGLVTCDQGAFLVTPPHAPGADWTIETLLEEPVGDVALCDIDQDGEDELLTVEPFHGTRICIRKKIDNRYQIVWEYPKPVDFGHVAWGGKLRGVPTFIGGCRAGCADLFYVRCESTRPLQFKTGLIEAAQGPSNVAVVCGPERDLIIAANRMVGECVVYIATD